MTIVKVTFLQCWSAYPINFAVTDPRDSERLQQSS